MSALSPAAALAARADALWTDAHVLTFATDAHSYADRVLLAIRRPTCSCVITIAANEYDGLKLAELLGFEQAGPNAMERAEQAKAAAAASKPKKRAAA